MSSLPTAREQAEMYLAKPRFHQNVTLPEVIEHVPALVSFGEYGRYSNIENDQDGTLASVNNADIPTILFMPGMFASRYTGVSMHALAEKLGVRIIVPDRFGFGQTANVALEERIPLWITIMPKFIQALGLKHVALASHGTGAIYNLNLIWHCRQVLDPENPVVFFLAPWVDPAHSKTSLARALKALPVSVIKQWNKIANMIDIHVAGSLGVSRGVLAKMVNLMTFGRVGKSGKKKNTQAAGEDNELDAGMQIELGNLATQGMFNENTAGANSEAICCLKKGPNGIWGEADDMNALIKKIVQKENETVVDGQKKLSVNIYFPKTDALIGKKGQKYFETCWLGNEADENTVDVKVTTVENSDHDSIISHAGVLKSVFQAVAGVSAGEDVAEPGVLVDAEGVTVENEEVIVGDDGESEGESDASNDSAGTSD